MLSAQQVQTPASLQKYSAIIKALNLQSIVVLTYASGLILEGLTY